MILWIGLIVSLALLFLIAQRNLYLAMFAAAVSLGLITLPLGDFFGQLFETFTDPSVVSLALVVAAIAMIGGTLERSGGMRDLVRNMRIGKKPFLIFSPALLGMLPMPGGALLSAPMVEESGSELSGDNKAALNVWFRHILFFIYPLATALIASAKIAGLEVYGVIPYLMPFFVLTLFTGYYFTVRHAGRKMDYSDAFSPRGLLVPLSIILVAPMVDLLLKVFMKPEVTEYATLAGVLISFAGAVLFAGYGGRGLLEVTRKMQPWNFSLIILGMFAFLNVFESSGAPEELGSLDIPLPILLVFLSFLLGFATGRIQAPASIIIPIYLARFGGSSMPPVAFAITYFSIFLGYVVTPVHPCVSVSIEYFGTSLQAYMRRLIWPTLISLLVAGLLAVFLL